MNDPTIKDVYAALEGHRNEWRVTVEQSRVEARKARRWLGWPLIIIILLGALPILFLARPEIPQSSLSTTASWTAETTLLAWLGSEPELERVAGEYAADAARSTEHRSAMIKGDTLYLVGPVTQSFQIRGQWRTELEFRGAALWHEDISDPGDAAVVNFVLKRQDDGLLWGFSSLGEPVTRFETLGRNPDNAVQRTR